MGNLLPSGASNLADPDHEFLCRGIKNDTKMREWRVQHMAKPLWMLPMLLICAALGQATSMASSDTTGSLPAAPTVVNSQSPVKPLPDLPVMPSGKSTVVGGEIKQLDRV